MRGRMKREREREKRWGEETGTENKRWERDETGIGRRQFPPFSQAFPINLNFSLLFSFPPIIFFRDFS
jgi:hypothetical protein